MKGILVFCVILAFVSAVKMDEENHLLASPPAHQMKILGSIVSPCPPGKTAHDNGVPPNPNGCGSSSSQVKIGKYLAPYIQTFTPCCNGHDICYDKCGGPDFKGHFKKCNDEFRDCMYSKCKGKAAAAKWYAKKGVEAVCKTNAYTFYQLVSKGGKTPYEKAQKKHCSCS